MSPTTYRIRPFTPDELTDEQIEELRTEAGQAGDDRMVITCESALAGDDNARSLCCDVINDWNCRKRS
jgi:hypothetical protein